MRIEKNHPHDPSSELDTASPTPAPITRPQCPPIYLTFLTFLSPCVAGRRLPILEDCRKWWSQTDEGSSFYEPYERNIVKITLSIHSIKAFRSLLKVKI